METLPPMRAIQAFEAIARCGSVAAAADELGVSPGAISQQLHKIEAELNVRLFYREGRTLKLTSWGLAYYPRVRAAFDQLRRAQHALNLARTKRSIVLSTLHSLSAWLRRHLLSWHEVHTGVSVTLLGTDKESPLQEDGIDFRLCYGSDARKYDRFAELFVDAVVPVCAPELIRRYPVRSEADIVAAPLIEIAWEARHPAPPTWADWAWSVGLGARETRSNLAFSQSDAAIDAALCGGGFVLGQISMIADHVRQGRLVVPIDRRLTMPEPYFLAWDRDTLDRPLAAGFRNALIAAGRQQSALSSGTDSLAPARPKT
jgi:LysR family transcriptional regulator, glycine cleavage system transcriptional activator